MGGDRGGCSVGGGGWGSLWRRCHLVLGSLESLDRSPLIVSSPSGDSKSLPVHFTKGIASDGPPDKKMLGGTGLEQTFKETKKLWYNMAFLNPCY